MSYAVRIKPSAEKALGSLSRQAESRIAEIFEALTEDPRPPGHVKLQGEDGLYRVRVGDYRVLYQIEDEELIVLVVRIGHRREVFRRQRRECAELQAVLEKADQSVRLKSAEERFCTPIGGSGSSTARRGDGRETVREQSRPRIF